MMIATLAIAVSELLLHRKRIVEIMHAESDDVHLEESAVIVRFQDNEGLLSPFFGSKMKPMPDFIEIRRSGSER